ncbi:zinc-binding dehydrogenase, partial [Staphylococcus aureus]
EQVVVDASQVAVVPDDVDMRHAALLACGVITGFGAVSNTAQMEPGATVAVIGAGGVGLNSIQGAALCGASQIVAVDVVAEKLDAARRFGATATV